MTELMNIVSTLELARSKSDKTFGRFFIYWFQNQYNMQSSPRKWQCSHHNSYQVKHMNKNGVQTMQ